MFNKILIGLLYIPIFVFHLHRALVWPYEKIFKLFYETFIYIRKRDLEDINWCKTQIWKLKRKNA